jgi:type II secretory pathway pseudopilin PulG
MRSEPSLRSRRQNDARCSKKAFTITELAIVVAVLALLIILVFPALAGTARQDKSAVCMSNLRQIYVGMMTYAADNKDTLHHTGGSIPNSGQWTANPASSVILAPDHSAAYWGVAYYTYVGIPRELFRCPSAKFVDQWRDAGLSYPDEFWLTSTYGISQYLITPFTPPAVGPLKISSFQNPSTMICIQDSVEQKPEGATDSIGLFPGQTQILTQWIGVPPPYGGQSTLYGNYPFEWEYYRHERRCNTLWVSGHTSKIPYTGLTVGIDYRYYTGDKPVIPIPENQP